jgi:hypothetical protein
MANSYIGQDNLPMGLRNNNVGNLRPVTGGWEGQVGTNSGFAVFQDLAWGIRAFAVNFNSSVTRHGTDTLAAYINRYAPPSDNNQTSTYLAYVATATGLDPNAPMPTDEATVKSILRAQINVELGDNYSGYVTDSDIDEGFALLDSPLQSLVSAAGIYYSANKSTVNLAVIGAVVIGLTAYIYFVRKKVMH